MSALDARRSYLAGGHVYCRSRHADVDVDECLRCARLIEVQTESFPPYIVCDAISAFDDDAAHASYASWWHRHHRRAR